MIEHLRILQTNESLTLILKNTHFTDLGGATVGFRIIDDLPALLVKFPEPAYDFLMVLNLYEMGGKGKWTEVPALNVILEISDPIIADQISRTTFVFSENETKTLVDAFCEQKLFPQSIVSERIRRIKEQEYQLL